MASFSLDNPVSGSCNCGSVSVSLEQGQNIICSICYCFGCRRSGGGYSVNYLIGENDAQIKDPQGHLRLFNDGNTDTGNEVQRNFCGNCGSPVFSLSPVMFPGQMFLKASIFDTMKPPSIELFARNRDEWQGSVKGAQTIDGGS